MQGKSISGYTLQRLLGTGGMAEVWYAENKIGKKAAVKLLLPKLCQDENLVSRFLTEARVMVELNHPNIRQVYDYGEIDGRPAIVMEYLEGEDLKARLKRGQRFTDEELKHWWSQLVDALNYTHKKGIIHRDIKPGNIFVDMEGNAKLLDFGIAKVRDSISTTLTGQKLGTLMYMSPEQVKDSKHIDYKTDIYSLAVTFVHLITGKKPYDSDTSSDYDIQVSIVTKPMDLNDVPANWRNFLEPYLNKEPQDRPDLKYYAAAKKKTTPKKTKSSDEETIVDEVKPKQTKTTGRKPHSTTKKKTKNNETDDEPKAINNEVETKGSDSQKLKNTKKYWLLLLTGLALLGMALLITYLGLGVHWVVPAVLIPLGWLLFWIAIVLMIKNKRNKNNIKFCKKCGSPIYYEAQYCRKCGNRIS